MDFPRPSDFQSWLAACPPYRPAPMARGIVMCAGGHRLLANAYVTLRRIRQFSDLPVEIFYAGPSELPPGFADLLQEELEGVTFRDLHCEAWPGPLAVGDLRSFHIKPYALLCSSFREVLLVDADNLPIRPFEGLFLDPQYLRTGALLWPDLPEARWTEDALFESLGLDPTLNRQSPEMESGQMVVDRERCWRALTATCLLCSDALRPFVFARTNGDKDTFRLAFLFSQTDYALVRPGPVAFGGSFLVFPLFRDSVVKLDHPLGSFYPTGIVQHDPQGQPLFAHKSVMEWKPYLNFVGMTHVQVQGQVRGDPELAQLETWGVQQLDHFRRRYRRLFPADRREQVQEWARRVILAVLDLIALIVRGVS